MSTEITLNEAQKEAVHGALNLRGSRDEIFTVAGLAGTGKTVALIELVRQLKMAGYRPAVCAPTGKAAHVITGKADGLFIAKTLHSALTENPVDHLKEINARIGKLRDMIERGLEKAPLEAEIKELEEIADRFKNKSRMSFHPIDPELFYELYDCLVVDEASMIGMDTMRRPFMDRIRVPKFFFGDDGQLPPVQDKPAVSLSHPTVRLTEIHRQAEGSGIIHVAHSVRKNSVIDTQAFEEYEDLGFETDASLPTVMKYAEDHQILVWKNVTRHQLNSSIRGVRGFDYMALPEPKDRLRPMVGEELLFDQNSTERGFFKGQPFRVLEIEDTEKYLSRFSRNRNPYITAVKIGIDRPGGILEEVEVALCLRDLIPPSVRLKETAREDNYMRIAAERQGLMCMYPYALTVHKAQGSEWENVCVVGEYPQRMDKFAEWFYTAVTRASKRLVVCSNTYFKKPRQRRTLAQIRAEREEKAS
jgi:exodeoxyribonuclease-5